MLSQFSRTELLLGKDSTEVLRGCRVAIFGVGGVGGYVAEALARSGVGSLDLIDKDTVSLTNLNRQIIATHVTLGLPKVNVMKERILAINPEAIVSTYQMFFLPETQAQFDFTQYAYVVDAVDTVTAKIALVLAAQAAGVPVISCMGAGNKMDPTQFKVADIYETKICPLARVMRRALKLRGVKKLKVVFSTEEALMPALEEQTELLTERARGHSLPGSSPFTPAVAGLIIAAEVVKDLTGWKHPGVTLKRT